MARISGLMAAYLLTIVLTAVVILVITFSSYLPQISIMSSREEEPGKVVIVGGGLAGLSATIEAHRHGAHVTIIEKEKGLGGNSAKATSGMNGANTRAQHDARIDDSVTTFAKDTVSSGDGLANRDLVSILATNSAEAHEFLRSFGLNMTDIVQLGGHSVRRTHRIPPTPEGKPIPIGFTIVNTLKKYVENELKDKITIITNAQFEKVLLRDGKAVGVEYTDIEGVRKQVDGTVVLAAGGFANDHSENSLLDQYAPNLAKMPTTNGPWATGDIIKKTVGLGLSLIHMDKVQVHPTGFVEPSVPNHHTKFLAPEALRGCGAILLDGQGKRFANELGRRDYLTQKILEHGFNYDNNAENPTVAAMLLTSQIIDHFGAPSAGFYKFKKLILDLGSLEDAANSLKVPLGNLQETIKSYRADIEKGDDEFGKKDFPHRFSEDDHFLIAFVTPSLHYCMGGIEINHQAQVIQQAVGDAVHNTKVPLDGLYAAGEVSGGVHGNNRLGGNSLLECVVFGRIAGQHAAHYQM